MPLSSMAVPSLGQPSAKTLSHCQQWKVNRLLQLMPWRRPYGSSCSSNRFSVPNLFPSNFIQTTSLWLHLQKTINTMPKQKTSTSIIISSAGSSTRVPFDSFTALPMTWSLTCSPRPFLLWKSSILPHNSGFCHLEGLQGADALRSGSASTKDFCSPTISSTLLFTCFSFMFIYFAIQFLPPHIV